MKRLALISSLSLVLLVGVAIAAIVWSEWSDPSTETTLAEPLEVNTPEIVTTAQDSSSVLVEWSSVDAEVCEVERDGVVVATVDHNLREYLDEGLTPETAYTYRVRCGVDDEDGGADPLV